MPLIPFRSVSSARSTSRRGRVAHPRGGAHHPVVIPTRSSMLQRLWWLLTPTR